jgi:hypothetical protein
LTIRELFDCVATIAARFRRKSLNKSLGLRHPTDLISHPDQKT